MTISVPRRDEDVECVGQMCRALGNITEVSQLHLEILQVFPLELFDVLNSHSAPPVVLDANLTCNFSIHDQAYMQKLTLGGLLYWH